MPKIAKNKKSESPKTLQFETQQQAMSNKLDINRHHPYPQIRDNTYMNTIEKFFRSTSAEYPMDKMVNELDFVLIPKH